MFLIQAASENKRRDVYLLDKRLAAYKVMEIDRPMCVKELIENADKKSAKLQMPKNNAFISKEQLKDLSDIYVNFKYMDMETTETRRLGIGLGLFCSVLPPNSLYKYLRQIFVCAYFNHIIHTFNNKHYSHSQLI